MITTCYDGQAKITTVFRSFGTDADARRIRSAVIGAMPLLKEEDAEVSLLALLLSNTLSVEWNEQSEEVKAFKDYWDWINEAFILSRDEAGYVQVLSDDPVVCADVWRKYRRMIGNQAQREWYDAFASAQRILPPAPEMAKEADLPDDLKEDADFLGEGEKQGSDSVTDASITSVLPEDSSLEAPRS